MAGDGTPRQVVESVSSVGGLGSVVESGLVDLTRDGEVRVRHGVVANVVYREIPTGRRDELHHAVGNALKERGAAAPAVIARHLLEAADLDTDAAIEAGVAAASAATALGAHRDAAHWLRRAGEAARSGGRAAQELSLRVALGDALRLAGDPRHVDLLLGAAEEADLRGDTVLFGEAVFALLQLGGATVSTAVDARIERIVQRALDRVADPAVAGAASLALSMTGDTARSRALFVGAEAKAADSAARRAVLPFAYLALGLPDDLALRERLGEELIAISREADDPVARFEGLHLRFSNQLQRGDGVGLRETHAEMTGLVEVVGDVGRRWAVHYQSAAISHLDDDLTTAERQSEEALNLFAPVSTSRALAVYQGQLLPLRIAQHRVGELREPLALLVEGQPGVPAWHAAYALALAESDAQAAREHLGIALESEERDFTWLAAQVVGGRAAATAAHNEDRSVYAERLAPYSGLVCWQGTCAYGPVDTTLALLARADGDEGAAGRHATAARDTAARLAAPVFLRELDRLGL